MASSHGRAILRLAGPAILGQVLQTGVIYADRAMLGHLGDGTALSALQVAGPLEWTLVSVASAFSVATLSMVGRAVGAGDRQKAQRITRLSLWVALSIGVLATLIAFTILLPTLGNFFPEASRQPGGALESARGYLGAAFLATPLFCIGVTGCAALAASGDTVTPLVIGIAVNLVHVVINAWLIPKFGARGAGISTSLSFALEAILVLGVLGQRHRIVSLRGSSDHFPPARSEARRLLQLSTPAVAERAIYHAGYMAFVYLCAQLGDDAMAANQALIAIEAISFMTVDGFATATGALVAQRLGSSDVPAARSIGNVGATLAAVTLSTFGAIFLTFRHALPSLITPRADLIAMAAQAILVMALAQPFMAAAVVYGQAFRGAGLTRITLLTSIMAGFGVRLIVTGWLTSHHPELGVTAIWMGSTADWIFRAVLLTVWWPRAPLQGGHQGG